MGVHDPFLLPCSTTYSTLKLAELQTVVFKVKGMGNIRECWDGLGKAGVGRREEEIRGTDQERYCRKYSLLWV